MTFASNDAQVWMICTAPVQPTYVWLVGGHGGLNARRDRLDPTNQRDLSHRRCSWGRRT